MGKQTYQEKPSKEAFRIVEAIFSTCFPIKFCAGPNAKYGHWDFFYRLAAVCMGRSCANGASETTEARSTPLALPTCKWPLSKIKLMRRGDIPKDDGAAIKRSALHAKRKGI